MAELRTRLITPEIRVSHAITPRAAIKHSVLQ
jgi:hypothetical protein